MPSGKPGKFSTSVVVMRAPPNWEPSNTSGCRLARAAYVAAVYPAGPDPMMIRSRTPSCSAGGMAGCSRSTPTAGPGVGWESFTGGTTPIVGAAFPAPQHRSPVGERVGSARGVDGDLGEVGLGAVLHRHQAGDPHQHVARGHRLLELEVGAALDRALGSDGEAVDGAVRRVAGADLHRRAGLRRGDRHRRQGLLAAQVV